MSKAPPPPMAAAPPAPRQTAAPTMRVPQAHTAGVRVVFVAVNGFGKTTTGALAENSAGLIAPDEHGYLTLLSRGLVPAIPIMQPTTWPETLASLDAFIANPEGRKVLFLDALTGFAQMLAVHVCKTQFGGDWSKKGFLNFYTGPKQVENEWPAILSRLTRISRAGVHVLFLGHAKVKNFKNPDGPDFDRYECQAEEGVWASTRNWAEACIFGNFRAIVDTARPESNIAKASGKAIGQERIIRAQYSAAADAKNQYGLEPEYVMPNTADEFASAFWNLILPRAK